MAKIFVSGNWVVINIDYRKNHAILKDTYYAPIDEDGFVVLGKNKYRIYDIDWR